MISALLCLSFVWCIRAAIPETSVLKAFMGTFGESMNLATINQELEVTLGSPAGTCFAAQGWDGAALVSCNKNYMCPTVAAAKLTAGTQYSSTFLVSGIPSFQAASLDASKTYTVLHYDFGYAGGYIANIIQWLCVNTPAEGSSLNLAKGDCYHPIGLPGMTYPKMSWPEAYFRADSLVTAPASTYAFLLYEQSTSFGSVTASSGTEILKYGIDLFTDMGGDRAAATAAGGWFMYNLSAFAEANAMSLRAVNWYGAAGNAWSSRYLIEKGLPPFVPACDLQGDGYCNQVSTCPSVFKAFMGVFGSSMNFDALNLDLEVELSGVSETCFAAQGWDGAALVSCNKNYACPAVAAAKFTPGHKFSSTFLASGVPSFRAAVDASKTYTLIHYDFGYADGYIANIIQWLCANTPADGSSLNLGKADCYSPIGLPGMTYPKMSWPDAYFRADALVTAPASTYCFLLYEQSTTFGSVTESSGTEILKFGIDLFADMGGDRAAATAAGGWFMYNLTAFAEANAMSLRAVNWYEAAGNAWSSNYLVGRGLPPFVPACDHQGDGYCNEVSSCPGQASTQYQVGTTTMIVASAAEHSGVFKVLLVMSSALFFL